MRHDRTQFCDSDIGQQLLLFVPFQCAVTITQFCVAGPGDGVHDPLRVRLYVNKQLSSIADCGASGTLKPDEEAVIEVPGGGEAASFLGITNRKAFQSVHNLLIFIERNVATPRKEAEDGGDDDDEFDGDDFDDSDDEDEAETDGYSRLCYLGFKGTAKKQSVRGAIKGVVYEITGSKHDHEVADDEKMKFGGMGT